MARGRPGASDGDIQQAIEQILAEGDEPSLIKIRKRSGASYGTIGPIFERWCQSSPGCGPPAKVVLPLRSEVRPACGADRSWLDPSYCA